MSIRCAFCGKFISYKDLDDESAFVHQRMEMVGVHGGIREWEEPVCKRCCLEQLEEQTLKEAVQ